MEAIGFIPAGPATNTPVDGGPGSTDAVNATIPLELSAGQNPKFEKTPPRGAASPSATIFLTCLPSATNVADRLGASFRIAVNATVPALLMATRSENFAKIP